MENTDENIVDKLDNQVDNLPIRNEKGQIIKGTANPKGRPKGKTMKEFAREFLMSMSDEKKVEFLNSLSKDIVWRMAEGNPHNTEDNNIKASLIIQISQEIAEKNATNTITKDNSERPPQIQSGESGEEIR
jgi:hypothetical protein